MRVNIIQLKTFDFAVKIVDTCKHLENHHNEYVLSRQLKRSGTAPGALTREAKFAESRNDFIHKISIALKEANECHYWIKLIFKGNYIPQKTYDCLEKDCDEIIKILSAIVKSSKQNSK